MHELLVNSEQLERMASLRQVPELITLANRHHYNEAVSTHVIELLIHFIDDPDFSNIVISAIDAFEDEREVRLSQEDTSRAVLDIGIRRIKVSADFLKGHTHDEEFLIETMLARDIDEDIQFSALMILEHMPSRSPENISACERWRHVDNSNLDEELRDLFGAYGILPPRRA